MPGTLSASCKKRERAIPRLGSSRKRPRNGSPLISRREEGRTSDAAISWKIEAREVRFERRLPKEGRGLATEFSNPQLKRVNYRISNAMARPAARRAGWTTAGRIGGMQSRWKARGGERHVAQRREVSTGGILAARPSIREIEPMMIPGHYFPITPPMSPWLLVVLSLFGLGLLAETIVLYLLWRTLSGVERKMESAQSDLPNELRNLTCNVH